MTMTETGKKEEGGDLPLEGSPQRKAVVHANANDNSPSSAASLLMTPTSNRLSDADIFKTPEPVTPTSSAKKRKRLTPEERNLREMERQEKRRKLEEEKQKKEEEKQKRENERLEKLKQKEAERLKREEERVKKEQERKKLEEEKKQEKQKKEEERLKKEEERKKLEEEKKQEKLKKEEERLKKEEERKKKEDERKQKEEEKEQEKRKIEEKKAKQAQFFTNFFQKSSAPKVTTIEDGVPKTKEPDSEASVGAAESVKNSVLFNPLPFQVKTDMAVAPLCRRKLSDGERGVLDGLFEEGRQCSGSDVSNVWFASIKKRQGRKYGRTDVMKESPDIQIMDESDESSNSKPLGCFKWRMKLLQFEENRRPAYWGTWKRKTKRVNPRKPFTKEEEVDYDFDSDDEWEDEPEDAEEIGDSDKEDGDEEGGEDEEDEEGWMVPHGYLSDTERDGTNEDLESLKCKEKEFYKSLKEKTMIGFPFIITDDLSCYKMRLCPVFRAPPVVKKRKPRAPAKKKVEQSEEASKENTTLEQPEPVKSITPTPPVENTPTSSPTSTPTNKRKSGRKTKVTDQKPNPYAKPPSGFLALDLPSDDEEDMDWEDDAGSSSSASESGDSEGEDDKDGDNSEDSDSDEDLFIPVVRQKPKE